MKGDSPKSILSTRQTQKSFSIIDGLMPSFAATSEKMSRRSLALEKRAQPYARGVLLGDLLDSRIDPPGGGLRVEEYLLPQHRIELFTNLRKDFGCDPVFSVSPQRLNKELTLAEFESCLLECGVLEGQRGLPNCVRSVRSVGKIDHPSRNLGGKSEEILSGGAIWLDAPGELARKCMGNLVDVWADTLLEQFAVPWVIVDAADDPSDEFFLFAPVERRING